MADKGSSRRKKATRATASGGSRRRRRPFVFRLLGWVMTLAVWGIIAFTAATAYVFLTLDSKGLFRIPEREPGIMLVAADGQVIAERGSFFGDEARLSELPAYVPQAVIAIEDRRFYHHFGIDPLGMARAMVTNLRAGRIVQGLWRKTGSTSVPARWASSRRRRSSSIARHGISPSDRRPCSPVP